MNPDALKEALSHWLAPAAISIALMRRGSSALMVMLMPAETARTSKFYIRSSNKSIQIPDIIRT